MVFADNNNKKKSTYRRQKAEQDTNPGHDFGD